ncbi:uncharacterized protein DS421_5g142390 [Arachis hypogaea]|nr:uncharacterized protein DS421_5g142390 [Arachis hypogaea]
MKNRAAKNRWKNRPNRWLTGEPGEPARFLSTPVLSQPPENGVTATLIGAADGGGGRLVCVEAGVAGRGSPSLVVFSASRVAHRRLVCVEAGVAGRGSPSLVVFSASRVAHRCSSITGRLLCFVLAYRRWSSSLLRG